MIEDAHESAIGHVTGTARYVDDIPCPADVCHVAIGLSTIANGEIKHVDLEEVRNSEGVLDVVICEDIPGNLFLRLPQVRTCWLSKLLQKQR